MWRWRVYACVIIFAGLLWPIIYDGYIMYCYQESRLWCRCYDNDTLAIDNGEIDGKQLQTLFG